MGKVLLTISDPEGNAIPSARVELSNDGEIGNFIPAYPNEKGLIELSLPLGEWKVNAKDNGRDPVESVITVKKDATTKKSISMTAQSGIHFSITKEDGSPTPCKAQIIGIREQSVQNLALLTGHMDAMTNFIQKMENFPSDWLQGITR